MVKAAAAASSVDLAVMPAATVTRRGLAMRKEARRRQACDCNSLVSDGQR